MAVADKRHVVKTSSTLSRKSDKRMNPALVSLVLRELLAAIGGNGSGGGSIVSEVDMRSVAALRLENASMFVDSVHESKSIFGRMMRANTYYVGKFVNKSCETAVEMLHVVAEMALEGYVTDHFRSISKPKIFRKKPRGITAEQRIVQNLMYRMAVNRSISAEIMLPHFRYEAVRQVLREMIKGNEAEGVYDALLDFYESDGGSESVARLVDRCETEFSNSTLARTVAVSTHMLNLTEKKGDERLATELIDLAKVNEKALEIAMFLLLKQDSLLSQKISLTDWWRDHSERLNPTVMSFYEAVAPLDIELSCDARYTRMKHFIDASVLSHCSEIAEEMIRSGDWVPAVSIYYTLAATGHFPSAKNARFADRRNITNETLLPMLFSVEAENDQLKLNRDAHFMEAWRSRDNFSRVEELLDLALAARPEAASAIHLSRFILSFWPCLPNILPLKWSWLSEPLVHEISLILASCLLIVALFALRVSYAM